MAQVFLIDGYNVLYALPEMPKGSWEEKREALVRRLLDQKPYGQNRVVLVFDSRSGGGDRSTRGDLEIVFTSSETADDWISRRVRELPNPRVCVVVTNDKGIHTLVRGTGASVLSNEAFWALHSRKAERPSSSATPIDTDSINDELKKKWGL